MSFKFPNFKNERFDIEKSTIILSLGGSRSYGTNTDTSDFDYKGVLVTPKSDYLNPFTSFEQAEWKDKDRDEEGVIYAFDKFIKLAANCNPNIIEILFTDESHLKVLTPEGRLLRDNRDIFLSTKAANSFVGYAMSQLKRIESHKKWIDNPPSENDKKEYEKYKSWVHTRNSVRAEIELKHGFDLKHAMHLVRLMRMGKEILLEGAVNVYRKDKEELVSIRNGSWSYEDIISWSDEQKKKMNEIVSEGLAAVPSEPDYDKIIKISEQVYDLRWLIT